MSDYYPTQEYYPREPYSEEAEQAVLGGLMIDNSAFDRVADVITAEDFYYPNHRIIFQAIASLAISEKPIDVVFVADALNAMQQLDDVGGLAYVGCLAQNVPTAAHIRHYAEIVKERSQLRKLISICNDGVAKANAPGAVPQEVIESLDKKLLRVMQFNQRPDFVELNQTLNTLMVSIDRGVESQNGVTGVATGLADLDCLTSGLQPGDLVIIAARPSMGKTAAGLSICLKQFEEFLESENKDTDSGSVQIYSLEMSADQVVMRVIGQMGRLPIQGIRQGNLQQSGWEKFTDVYQKLQGLQGRLLIDDTPDHSPTTLRAKVRRTARKLGLPKLIMIDYVQLMKCDRAKENRNLEVSEISKSLKALAKEMRCPVVALSQLNRALENRPDKRPLMSDLRDSGALEQDADLVVFIYRDEVYHPNSHDKGTAEMIVAKHRNGPTGTVKVAFLAESTLFTNLQRES